MKTVLVYILAILAALFFGCASVVQQRSAAQAPPQDMLSIKLLLWLVRQRLWLFGIGLAIVGNVLSATALGRGSVALVEPLFVLRLLFALPLAAAWMRRSVARRDWVGAAMTTAGLAMFVVAGRPGQGSAAGVPTIDWIVAGSSIVALALGLTALARQARPVRAAALLGAGAGVLFGLQASLTHSAIHVLSTDGVAGLLRTWQPYAVLAVALLGMLLIQSAYEAAPLPASFPAMVAAEPLTGIAVGVGVLGGTLHLDPVSFAIEVAGIAIMVGGVYLLASSPLVTGQLDLLERRQEEGLAYRAATMLERDLAAFHRELDAVEQALGDPARRQRAHRNLTTHLRRIDTEVGRLCALREDIERHRLAERERVADRPPDEQADFAREDEDLDARQHEIDRRTDELCARSRRLQERADELVEQSADADAAR